MSVESTELVDLADIVEELDLDVDAIEAEAAVPDIEAQAQYPG